MKHDRTALQMLSALAFFVVGYSGFNYFSNKGVVAFLHEERTTRSPASNPDRAILGARYIEKPKNHLPELKSNGPLPKWSLSFPQVNIAIYVSRYQITGRADERTIRQRVRYYRSHGISTIVHGVWGNGCPMYRSDVMLETFGYESCPNEFQDKWLEWLIDEAQKQGMEVHAYFEKGIKIDKDSPLYDTAQTRGWIVPGVDRTYPGIDHYVLDVEVPEVSELFEKISGEFVRKYPSVSAVQWDDYLAYHRGGADEVNRTAALTTFVQRMRAAVKDANPDVSFDVCHHNPYWSKRYFSADWKKWGVDRAFIQAYSDENYGQELRYARNFSGIALSEKQLHHVGELMRDRQIKTILLFPLNGDPEGLAEALSHTKTHDRQKLSQAL